MEIGVWDVFKAVGLNEVSKRMGGERGEEASEHSSIGEGPEELAKRAACGVSGGKRRKCFEKEGLVSCVCR